jgi:hypothetical protein
MLVDITGRRVRLPKTFTCQEGAVMLVRKTITAALTLAVVAASSTPALAKAGGTHRPIRSRDIGGIGTVNLRTGAFSSDATELVSHIGKARSHSVGTIVITGPGTFTTTFIGTEVAPNGDELTLFVTGTGTFTAAGSDATFVATITGGTGRFADASGMTTGTIHTTNISNNGVTLVFRTTSEGTGYISY